MQNILIIITSLMGLGFLWIIYTFNGILFKGIENNFFMYSNYKTGYQRDMNKNTGVSVSNIILGIDGEKCVRKIKAEDEVE